MNSYRPTTELLALFCKQYREMRDPSGAWQFAHEARDQYAVHIADDAIAGRALNPADVYAFTLFDRLSRLHSLKQR
jgi:hypothetical protein